MTETEDSCCGLCLTDCDLTELTDIQESDEVKSTILLHFEFLRDLVKSSEKILICIRCLDTINNFHTLYVDSMTKYLSQRGEYRYRIELEQDGDVMLKPLQVVGCKEGEDIWDEEEEKEYDDSDKELFDIEVLEESKVDLIDIERQRERKNLPKKNQRRKFMEQRELLRDFYKSGLTAVEAYAQIAIEFGERKMSRSAVFFWYRMFKKGREEIEDVAHPRKPRTAVNEKNIERVANLLCYDNKMPMRKIASILNISLGSVDRIVRLHLGHIDRPNKVHTSSPTLKVVIEDEPVSE